MHHAIDPTETIARRRINDAREIAARLLEQRKQEIREDLRRRLDESDADPAPAA